MPSAKLAAVLCAAAVVLAGCATVPAPGTPDASGKPAASAADRYPESYRERIAEVMHRTRAACVAEDYQPYFRKTACLPTGITDEMTRDRTRITAAQKRAARALFTMTRSLNEETRRIMIETGDPELVERAESSRLLREPKINALQESLLDGSITWGEYNAERRRLARSASDAGESDESAE